MASSPDTDSDTEGTPTSSSSINNTLGDTLSASDLSADTRAALGSGSAFSSGGGGARGRGGGWTLTQVGTAAERMERDREIAHLEARLAEVDTWMERIEELDVLLGAKQVTGPEPLRVVAGGLETHV